MSKGSSSFNGVAMVLLSMAPIPFAVSIASLFQEGELAEAIIQFFQWSFFVFLIASLASILIGIPVYSVLKSLNLARWQILLPLGAISGGCIGVFLFPYGDPLALSLIFGSIGCYASAAFWYGAEKR